MRRVLFPAIPSDTLTMTAPALSGISALKAIYGVGGDVGDYADNDEPDHKTAVVGVSVSAANAGQSFDVRTTGVITDASFNFDLTKPVFLGKTGALTQDLEQATGAFLLVIGFPASEDTLVVRPLSSVTIAA